jgi:2-keto-3-deoxy-L-rhamnonate aldolase RhmA
MPLVPNKTRRKMLAGEVALGFGVHHLRSAAAPVLAAATGHDWLFLDNEHGAFSVHEIAQLCIASLPTGVTPLVRVCANAIDEATRALDNGASLARTIRTSLWARTLAASSSPSCHQLHLSVAERIPGNSKQNGLS